MGRLTITTLTHNLVVKATDPDAVVPLTGPGMLEPVDLELGDHTVAAWEAAAEAAGVTVDSFVRQMLVGRYN